MKKLLLGLVALIIVAGDVAFAQLAPPPMRPTSLAIDSGTKTAAATAGAATLSKSSGVITSEALTTAAGVVYTLTLTNTVIAATDQVFVSVGNGTNTTVGPALVSVTPAAGSVVIVIRNTHASAALNGTIKVAFAVLKP